MECEVVVSSLLLRRVLAWPSLNGGAVGFVRSNGKAERVGRGGERRGRAQPKSGGPADPKGETPLAYMRSKKEGALTGRGKGQFHNLPPHRTPPPSTAPNEQ